MEIAIGFDNFEILKIDDRDFTVEINAYLIVKWKDPRVIIDFYQVSIISFFPDKIYDCSICCCLSLVLIQSLFFALSWLVLMKQCQNLASGSQLSWNWWTKYGCQIQKSYG